MFLTQFGSLKARVATRLRAADEATVRRLTFTIPLIASVPQLLIWAAIYSSCGERTAATVFWTWSVIVFVEVVLLLRFPALLDSTARFQFGLTIVLNFGVSFLLGGLRQSGGQFYWGVLAPLGILFMFGPRQALGWFSVFTVFVGAFPLLGFAGLTVRRATGISPEILEMLHALNFALPALFIFSALLYFIIENRRFFTALQIEKEKSQRLLLNVLPEEIADALKGISPFAPMQPIAKNYEAVTIVFLDIVGFTGLSKQQRAEETLRTLNDLFSGFDAIVERHEIEKIKTIGDCYMVASGIPRERADHAIAAVAAAIEMAEFVRHQEKHKLSFRIGIHSGPVAAGVIGRKKFLFDVWGDTVNTASRMESHGSEGQIQISRATFELVRDQFACEPRGFVELKGHGEMEAWFVSERQTPLKVVAGGPKNG